MNVDADPSLQTLNDCGCCIGLSPQTPVALDNRPGLSAVAYRIGTWAQFKASMLARLSAPDRAALQPLRTRDDDDFTIALLDAWATVADVLTFYQERIANESYLATATETFSLRQLGQLIGYALRPGVAAGTYLTFTLENQDLSKQPYHLQLAPGIKVQSVPGPGETPQTFETVEPIEARSEWNALKPRPLQTQPLTANMAGVLIQGTGISVKQGDTVLIVRGGNSDLYRVLAVTTDAQAKTTRLDFTPDGLQVPSFTPPALPTGTVFTTPTPLADGVIANEILTHSWTESDLTLLASTQGWTLDALLAAIAQQAGNFPTGTGDGVFVLRQRASLFGHNAPKWDALPLALRIAQPAYNEDGTPILDASGNQAVTSAVYGTTWEGLTLKSDIGAGAHQVYLDNVYPGIVPGSRIALVRPADPTNPAVYGVTAVTETTRADFAITAKVTVLTLDSSDHFDQFGLRETNVLGQSEALPLAPLSIPDDVQGDTLMLDAVYFGLKAGQNVMLTGTRSDLSGVVATELLTILKVTIDAGFTLLQFQKALTYPYLRATVTLNANVAMATQGETINPPETLGGGDGSQSFQQFMLKQPPLTYVSAPTADGTASTLQVWVNNILWNEVPSLYGHAPDERIFVTQATESGSRLLTFGDGQTGSRLPTGQTNVAAVYRKGIGAAGNVKAGQLSLLMTRPLGLKAAVNPQAASGGEDGETLDRARRNAPLTVRTLDRIVSVQDYEDFAMAFAGIGKALATWTWDGRQRGIFLTVAGANGAIVAADSLLHDNLLAAMRAAGDPTVSLTVASYLPATFRLAGLVKVTDGYQSDIVLAAVDGAMRGAFGFDARAFGQPVFLSEVVTVIQQVQGVDAVELTALYRTGVMTTLTSPLPSAVPQAGGATATAAELLTLDPVPLGLQILA